MDEKLKLGIRSGIIYEGGAITLTPYENVNSWSLLNAPSNAIFVNGSQGRQVFDQNKMCLLAGA
jgi:hypothetical protein